MPRFRQIYNIWGVFAGPAPAYSGHFANYNEVKHNNPSLSIFDINLLKQIDRVNSFSYGFDIERSNLTQLGVRGLVDRPIINRPVINVNFNYWSVGVRNEVRLGFVANYQDATGNPILTQDVCCFDNFTGQDTDYRNLFVAVSPDENDLNNRVKDQFFDSPIHPSGLFVFGFGNCYINSYRVRGAVGEIPQASVGYICDNVVGYVSGSGANIPAVYPKSGNLVSGMYFNIPRIESSNTPSVIRPADITLQINDINQSSSRDATWGVLSSGLAIQSFDLSVELDREDLRSIGYILPIDRRINFPIFANIDVSSIIDNNYSGNLNNLLDQNKSYDIVINMRNNSCDPTGRQIAIQYKIKDAKFENVNYAYDIGSKLIGNFRFSAEIDMNNSQKGMFISGLLNEPIPEYPFNYLLLEDNVSGFFLTEDNNIIIINEAPLV